MDDHNGALRPTLTQHTNPHCRLRLVDGAVNFERHGPARQQGQLPLELARGLTQRSASCSTHENRRSVSGATNRCPNLEKLAYSLEEFDALAVFDASNHFLRMIIFVWPCATG